MTTDIENQQKWPDCVVIVRHGESARNLARSEAKTIGKGTFGTGLRDVDTPLTPRGSFQAKDTGQYLSDHFVFDAVFSSPYTRTVQTTEGILAAFKTKPPVVLEERIREIEFGILDGLTREGIVEHYPNEFLRREREGKYWYRPPGGESRPDVALRVHSFLGTLTRDYSRKEVLIVCHSVVVLIFRRLLERWGEKEYMKVDAEDDVENCSVTVYRFKQEANKLALDCYNRTYYPDKK
jgi:2,3-bisphosphoglycerate-dependent phosphoglycerate mutase